jgi:hypothetical protein
VVVVVSVPSAVTEVVVTDPSAFTFVFVYGAVGATVVVTQRSEDLLVSQ